MIRRLLILHWILAVVITEVLIYALFHLVQRGGLPSGAFVVGLSIVGALLGLLAWPVSLHITQPLEHLEESALQIADGDLSVRVEILGRHMIGKQLGIAFNVMAEKVERMVRGSKELTANISHELRSPLTRIRIAGECLRDALDQGDREGAQEMLDAMWEDIEEADRIIGSILEFSKLDLREPLPMVKNVAPAEIIEGLVRTMTPHARTRRIEIKLDLDSSIRLEGDQEWLRAAFKNLLENALQYSPEKGAVQVAMRRSCREAIVEVTNTSSPLEPEELELIFKPFYRGKTSKGEGSGLGLSIVQKIVTLHHGQVDARNVPEGFQVWVRLPMAGNI